MKYAFMFCFLWLSLSKASAQTTPDSTRSTTPDSTELYGLIPQRPVKVGGLYTTGVANQRKYLESLRDAQGRSVSYERRGSCCAYPSENGFDGYALLDRYEVKYRDAEDKTKKVVVYISFYDFEETKAVKGFTLAK